MSRLAELAADDALLDALGARRPADDPLAPLLSAWAGFCDEPTARVVPIGRARGRRRRGVVIGLAIIGISAGGATGAAATGGRVPLFAPLIERFLGVSPEATLQVDVGGQTLRSAGIDAAPPVNAPAARTTAGRSPGVGALPGQPAAPGPAPWLPPAATSAQLHGGLSFAAAPTAPAAPTVPSAPAAAPHPISSATVAGAPADTAGGTGSDGAAQESATSGEDQTLTGGVAPGPDEQSPAAAGANAGVQDRDDATHDGGRGAGAVDQTPGRGHGQRPAAGPPRRGGRPEPQEASPTLDHAPPDRDAPEDDAPDRGIRTPQRHATE